jgi:hypothetical protein
MADISPNHPWIGGPPYTNVRPRNVETVASVSMVFISTTFEPFNSAFSTAAAVLSYRSQSRNRCAVSVWARSLANRS